MPRTPPRRISRFIVMAMLQAARARRLGLAERSAHSWGLNRAIFYAAAKRGFRGGGGSASTGAKTGEPAAPGTEEAYHLGEDFAYRDLKSPELYFTIGGDTQTEEDFRRQIAARFGPEENFRAAWEESERIVGRFDTDVLNSGSRFYADVYKPRRDELSEAWTERFLGAPSPDPTATGPVRPNRARAASAGAQK